MTDVQKELQKLKALINQRPTAVIFASKSNESDKVSHGDAEFYINSMSKKFVFTRAGIKNPIMIDPHMKSLENVEYINGTNVEVITEEVESINELKETVSKHDGRITVLEDNCTELDERLTNCENKNTEQDERITNCEDKNVEQDMKITQCQTGIGSCESNITNINGEITTITEQLNNHTHLGFGNDGLWHFKMFEEDEPGVEGDVGWNRNLVLQYRNWEGISRIMKFDVHSSGHYCTTEFNGDVVVKGNIHANNITDGEEIINEFRVGAKQITSRESEWGSGYGLLNIAFYTDGLYNEDLSGKTILIQAAYMLRQPFGNTFWTPESYR